MVQAISRAHTGNQKGRLGGDREKEEKWPFKGTRMKCGIKGNLKFSQP
jgi:hypothetical protein